MYNTVLLLSAVHSRYHGMGDAEGPKHSLIIVKNGNRSKHDVPDVLVIVVEGTAINIDH